MQNYQNIFQFTPLREGRPSWNRHARRAVYFNSRPSARGDHTAGAVGSPPAISIHAPPRGATKYLTAKGRSHNISIHAPPRGATGNWDEGGHILLISIHAPPRGATSGGLLDVVLAVVISIHAPPRGATITGSAPVFNAVYFNSRPSARGDPILSAVWCDTIDFNSRPSARGDVKRYAISANLLFNPYKSAWLNNSATQFVEIILVIFHRIIV